MSNVLQKREKCADTEVRGKSRQVRMTCLLFFNSQIVIQKLCSQKQMICTPGVLQTTHDDDDDNDDADALMSLGCD